MLKKVLSVSALALMSFSTVAPSVVKASQYHANIEQNKVPKQNNEKQERLTEYISEYIEENIEGDSGTVEISDTNLIKAFDKAGYDVPDTIPFANGVTKVDIHSLKQGNADLYLSKTFINNAISGGAGAVGAALGSLLPGVGWAAAIGAITGIIGAQSVDHGKVFSIRNFKYVGSRNQ